MSNRSDWFEILNRTIQNTFSKYYTDPSTKGLKAGTKIYFRDLISISPQFKHGLVFRAYGFYGDIRAQIKRKIVVNGETRYVNETLNFKKEAIKDKKIVTPSRGGVDEGWSLTITSDLIPHLLDKESFMIVEGVEFALPELWYVDCLVNDVSLVETNASFSIPTATIQNGMQAPFVQNIKQIDKPYAFFPGVQNRDEYQPKRGYNGHYFYDDQGQLEIERTSYNLLGYHDTLFPSGSSRPIGAYEDKTFYCIGREGDMMCLYEGNTDFSKYTTPENLVSSDCFEGTFVYYDPKAEAYYLVNPDTIKREKVISQDHNGTEIVEYYLKPNRGFYFYPPIHFNDGLGLKVVDVKSEASDLTYYYGLFNPTSQKVLIEKQTERPVELQKHQIYDWMTKTLLTLENNNSFAKVYNPQNTINVQGCSIGLTATSVATEAVVNPKQSFMVTETNIDVPVWQLLEKKHHLETWNNAKEFNVFQASVGKEVKTIAKTFGITPKLGCFVLKTAAGETILKPGQVFSVTREQMIGNPSKNILPSLYYRYGEGTEMGVVSPRVSNFYGDPHRLVLTGSSINWYPESYNY